MQKKDSEGNSKKKIEATVLSAPELIRFIATDPNYDRLKDILHSTDNSYIAWAENNRLPHIDWLQNASIDKQISLEQEINSLKKKERQLFNDLQKATSDREQIIGELRELKEERQSKEKINHILPKICEEARQKLLSDSGFRSLFDNARSCDSVVVSIDIRRSTELMLKARKPELFSKFITELSQKLCDAILSNYGVFDKFTGDGVLAFFPKFYSGEEAIIRALKAAEECHGIFNDHYKNSKECFNVFIKDVGLGIGVDFGHVTLVNNGNELTVVGIPVVYACRMSGANAGDTLLNQPAKEEIARLSSNYIKLSEAEINIKNEGIALAYKVEIHKETFNIKKPDWTKKNEIESPLPDDNSHPAMSNDAI